MATPARFNLPALSLRAIQAVLLHFDIPDLICLSYLSSSFYNIVKSVMYKNVWTHVSSCEKFGTNLKFLNSSGSDYGIWDFKMEKRKIGTLARREKNAHLYSSVTSVARYVVELTGIPVSNVEIEIDYFSIATIHSLKNLKIGRCNQLFIKSGILDDKGIPNRVLASLLKHNRATERIYIHAFTKKSFECPISFFQSRRLDVRYPAPWLTKELVFKLKCISIRLKENTILSVEDCFDFVKRWVKSDLKELEKFEYLDVAFEAVIKKLDVLKCLQMEEPIQIREWDEKMRGSYYRLPDETLNCEKGYDIIHKKWRLVATVLVRDRRFFFGVWHIPFPGFP
ncbi:hypothetical protein GCK72_017547 [Caenorhabditis remanei]|uniref:F-box domain-containing protein n=1 Tax=Caenorhabditis remanei TaxID=31234 RepID=A0A6A5G8G1_CAERE|nr:hypothetical protein GCK72_017547 [Caenorhabditis remanei]KAF1750995.1 hypothetical protein GCK72_017547 [Caenorhabditis remanei]